MMQQHSSTSDDDTSPQAPKFLSWTTINSTHDRNPFIFLPPSQPYSYGGFFSRGQSGYDEVSKSLGQVMHPMASSVPFGLHAELQRLTAQQDVDAKAIAASRSHSEAERRRRERINNHLANLRSLFPTTTKIDKASLLAEVIQHVKELRRQTSQIAETSSFPSETDELTVDNFALNEDGRPIIKASICCADRSDLLPDLIRALKALRLRALKAEIATLGDRVKNVLFITAAEEESNRKYNSQNDEDHDELYDDGQSCLRSIQEALKAVMEKSTGDVSLSVKRQRTNTPN